MRARYRSWTCRIDNTSLSPQAVLAEIVERTGAARDDSLVHCLPSNAGFERQLLVTSKVIRKVVIAGLG
jgi:hypothetical protein